MPRILVKHVGKNVHELHRSVTFFFQFLGELISQVFRHGNKIVWRKTLVANLYTGASIVIPLILISMLIGMAMALSIHITLTRFHVQQQAMIIAQTTMLRDIVPLPIGFVLCVHCGLNLIERDHPSLHKPPKTVLLETIIPLLAGLNLTAMLLYAYVVSSFLLSAFITSYFILQINTDEYLFRLGDILNPLYLLSSLGKTLFFSTIASLIAGYYYYGVASNVISTRLAVSRVITRSLFWIIIISVSLKLVIP
jgi:ABC-type transporter Mla maintaining outer membrane lipid asymmetry permease subunit MlaE